MSRVLVVWLLLSGALLVVCPAALAQSGAVSAISSDAGVSSARPADVDQAPITTRTSQPITAGRGRFILTHRLARDPGAGSEPERGAMSVSTQISLERQGHVLRLDVSSSFVTTPDMLARDGAASDAYPGFELSRKL